MSHSQLVVELAKLGKTSHVSLWGFDAFIRCVMDTLFSHLHICREEVDSRCGLFKWTWHVLIGWRRRREIIYSKSKRKYKNHWDGDSWELKARALHTTQLKKNMQISVVLNTQVKIPKEADYCSCVNRVNIGEIDTWPKLINAILLYTSVFILSWLNCISDSILIKSSVLHTLYPIIKL